MKKTRIACLAVAAAMMLTLMSACSSKQKVVMTVNGADIYSDEYNYYLGIAKSSIEASLGSEVWDGDSAAVFVEYAKSEAANQVIMRQALTDAFAENGIELTDEDRATLEQNKQDMIDEMGGTAAYAQALLSSNLTSQLYDSLQEFSYLYNKLYESFYGEGGSRTLDDTQFQAYYTENYVTAAQIMLDLYDDENNALDDAGKQAAVETLETLAQRARSGEDFNTLAQEYSEDTTLEDHPNGYTWGPDDVSTDIYNAVVALDEGEISTVVETSSGYYLFERLPLDYDYLSENRTDLMDQYYADDFNTFVGDLVEASEVTYSDEYADITINNVDLDAEDDTQTDDTAEGSNSTTDDQTDADNADANGNTTSDTQTDTDGDTASNTQTDTSAQ